MKRKDIQHSVRNFLTEHFLCGHAEQLPDDTSLLGDVIDSVGVLHLVIFIQDRFGIEVDDDEVIPSNLDTVNNLVSYVARKLGTQNE